VYSNFRNLFLQLSVLLLDRAKDYEN